MNQCATDSPSVIYTEALQSLSRDDELVWHHVEDDGEHLRCICGWVSVPGPERHQDRHIVSNPNAYKHLAELTEWACLWNGSLDNFSTPSNRGQQHWWCDWVNRVGIYGYDPVKLFPWRRSKRQWIHDAGWSGSCSHPDSVPWDGIGYPS